MTPFFKSITTWLFLRLPKKLRMKLILWETVKYYRKDPIKRRALDTTHYCVYYAEHTGAMCAVGRKMINPSNNDYYGYTVKEFKNIDLVLRPAYRGLPVNFWANLQDLHDDSRYWVDRGLSMEGVLRRKDILFRIAIGYA